MFLMRHLNCDVIGEKYEDIRDCSMRFRTVEPAATTTEVGNKCVLLVVGPCRQLKACYGNRRIFKTVQCLTIFMRQVRLIFCFFKDCFCTHSLQTHH